MRLTDFILANIESILVEWEAFASGIWPGERANPVELRDDAENILRATAWDMKSKQTAAEQADKSHGAGHAGAASSSLDWASGQHTTARLGSGFDLLTLVAEYRAVRASVIRLWRASGQKPDLNDLDDLIRFNESIDQSLTQAVRSYTEQVERTRVPAGQ